MSGDVVIRAEGLGKKYLIGQRTERERYVALRDVLARSAQGLKRKVGHLARGQVGTGGDTLEEFWALDDVSFEVKRGEVVGIIGRNGAGKSTLLKILSRITEPTAGRVTIKGRVASLLEVGTGFHPELTGRENIYLNGAILGMSRAEIRKKFDEIVAFAEVEKFLDTPVKRYSSGMYVRLAFAVAAHLEPEIMIVDEVLAVGDAQFQEKCLGKMSKIAVGGRTVLFVSHNMAAIRSLCDRGLLLDRGRIQLAGRAAQVAGEYSSKANGAAGLDWERPNGTCAEVVFSRASLTVLGTQPALKLHCSFRLKCLSPCLQSFVAVDIRDYRQIVIMQAIPAQKAFVTGESGNQEIRVEIELPPIIPGRYSLDAWVGPNYDRTYDYVTGILSFSVSDGPLNGRTYPYSADHGSIFPNARVLYSRTEVSDASVLQ